MLRILALFDAPIPAQRALAALAAAGLTPADVWSVPLVPGAARACLLAPVTDLRAVRSALAERQLPPDTGEVAVDAVRRGAILVLVEAPAALAPRVVDLLNGAGALDPVALAAFWAAHPGTTYDWAAIAPPVVDPPLPLAAALRVAVPAATVDPAPTM